MQFRCPVCGCPEYQRVVVPRSRGEPYETEFFHCLGCSLMFLEPELFKEAPEYRQTVRADALGAPEASLRSQAIRARFWTARAKRQSGGFAAATDAVRRLRERYRQ